MKVYFSDLAAFKLNKLTDYLESEWGEMSKSNFINKLEGTLISICQTPTMFPCSEYDEKLRRCVLTKQTSILYEIEKDAIYILNVIDNRQDTKAIFKEIKKHFG